LAANGSVLRNIERSATEMKVNEEEKIRNEPECES
jgi:hypothetical protein